MSLLLLAALRVRATSVQAIRFAAVGPGTRTVQRVRLALSMFDGAGRFALRVHSSEWLLGARCRFSVGGTESSLALRLQGVAVDTWGFVRRLALTGIAELRGCMCPNLLGSRRAAVSNAFRASRSSTGICVGLRARSWGPHGLDFFPRTLVSARCASNRNLVEKVVAHIGH